MSGKKKAKNYFLLLKLDPQNFLCTAFLKPTLKLVYQKVGHTSYSF